MTDLHPWWRSHARRWVNACSENIPTPEQLSAVIGREIRELTYLSEMPFPSPLAVSDALQLPEEVLTGTYKILVENHVLLRTGECEYTVGRYDS